MREPLEGIFFVVQMHKIVFTPQVFRAHFRVCCSIFGTCYPSYLMKFCTDVFCITLTVKKFYSTYPSAWGHYAIFWVYFGYAPQCLEKLHECLYITVVVNNLRRVLGISLLWIFLGVFGPFCTVSQIVGNHLIFSSEFSLKSPLSDFPSVCPSFSSIFFSGMGH